MFDNIAQLYKDQFDFGKDVRRAMTRDYVTDKKGRRIYHIEPGDKFIADFSDGIFDVSYLVMTTKETFEVYPGQDFYGLIILEERCQGISPYMLYVCGDKIALQDDDEQPWAIVNSDGAWIDYPSVFNNYDTYGRLKNTLGFKYWYKAYGINEFDHLEEAGFTVREIYDMNRNDTRLKRWHEAEDACMPKRKGRNARKYVRRTLPDINRFLDMIRSKFREIKYDEESKSLCF